MQATCQPLQCQAQPRGSRHQLRSTNQPTQEMAHLSDQWWKSHGFPLCVVLIKGRNCFCYKLSPRIDWLQLLQPLVPLDKEKDIILRAINNTDICLGISLFTANKKGEVHSRACQSFPTNITQNLEQFNGKIMARGFTLIGDHGKIKQPNQLCVTILLHSVSIENFQQLLINHRLWQLLSCKNR